VVELNVSLVLPRDALSVPVARHICDSAMGELGVLDSCRSDIVGALTEACTNVVDHSSDDHPYEVTITLDEARCSIRIIDPGSEADVSSLGPQAIDLDAETGRGISLMRALVDNVRFTREPDDGMVVHLTKQLEFDEHHPVREHLIEPASEPA